MIVYYALCPEGQYYIGITSKTLDARRRQHLQACVHSDTKFYRALAKNPELFVWGILDRASDWTELRALERYHVAMFNSYRAGYNSTPGGEGCRMEPTVYQDADGTMVSRYPASNNEAVYKMARQRPNDAEHLQALIENLGMDVVLDIGSLWRVDWDAVARALTE